MLLDIIRGAVGGLEASAAARRATPELFALFVLVLAAVAVMFVALTVVRCVMFDVMWVWIVALSSKFVPLVADSRLALPPLVAVETLLLDTLLRQYRKSFCKRCPGCVKPKIHDMLHC